MRIWTIATTTSLLFALGCGGGGTESSDDSSEATGASEPTDPSEPAGPTEPVVPVGPTIWAGPRITFEKVSDADVTVPANQDRITDSVALTRANGNGLYNALVEDSYVLKQSPAGTEWALGTTAQIDSLVFVDLKAAASQQMKNLPGKPIVLHLIQEDIYIDVTFLSWQSGSGLGGGFSYERTTP
jgi:hypothetical protein